MYEQINQSIAARIKPLALAAAAAVVAGSASVGRASPIVVTPGSTPGVNDVTSVQIERDLGTAPTSAGTVTGVGGSGAAFQSGNSYTVLYGNNIDKVENITAGGTTYAAFGLADNAIRRFTGANNDIVWESGKQTGTTNGSTVTLDGTPVSGDHEVFDQNAINMGADNLFSTITGPGGNPAGNNTNVARVDLLFSSGVKSATNAAFFVADRGASDLHDPFAIAAITSLDASGNPASYGQLLKLNAYTWGKTDLVPDQEHVVLRTDNDIPNDPLHPSDELTESVGGVAITTAELAGTTGETIYGYSLFGPALTVSGNGSGTQLDNWTNAGVYGHADFNNYGGGLDPAATLAVLYVAVPEPTTASIAMIAAGGLLLGRRRKAKLA